MRQPRDYQTRAIEAVRKAFIAGRRGVIIEAFTGAGKGYIIAKISELVRERSGRVLVLVNRDNLCDQLNKSLVEQGLFPSMERGLDKASPMSDLVVGSIQSMQGARLKKWPQNHFRLVITDEVHFGAAKTFKATLDHFKSSFHIGVTATIDRHDKKGIWDGYKDIVFSMPLIEGISEGWLVPLRFFELPVPIVLSDRENAKKAFGETDEENIFDRDSYLPRLFAESARESFGKKALMFWPGCKASELASEAFIKLGVESRHVDGYMPKNQIVEILDWFSKPGPKALHNANLLSYGYDNPSVDCVGVMRLLRSLPMLKQMIGRGTRPYKAGIDLLKTREERKAAIAASEKPNCLILDLMLQLDGAQSSFASCGQLVTDDKSTADYIREKRNTMGGGIDIEGLKDLIRSKQSDDERSLTKLAQDAANAAEKKISKSDKPYYRHILNNYKNPGTKPASDSALWYLKKLGYDGPDGITAKQCYLITELFKNHKTK